MHKSEKKQMKIGNVVKVKKGRTPKFGDGMNQSAVIVSLDPFILVSQNRSMKWANYTPDMVQIVSEGNPKLTEKCMKRL